MISLARAIGGDGDKVVGPKHDVSRWCIVTRGPHLKVAALAPKQTAQKLVDLRFTFDIRNNTSSVRLNTS